MDGRLRVFFCDLSEHSICISCPGAVNACKLMFSVDGHCYLEFFPEPKHAVYVLHLFSIFFFILDHQNMLLSASIFVAPGCPDCSVSTTGVFIFSGTPILSPTNSKPNFPVVLLKTGENSLPALFFCLLRTRFF